MGNKERFLELVSETDNSVLEQIKRRRDNRLWLRRSQAVAVIVLSLLKERGMSQKELASKMGISPQQVNKWLKGNENFTFETISKIEEALQTELMLILGQPRCFSSQMKFFTSLFYSPPQSPQYKNIASSVSKIYTFNSEQPQFSDHY